MADSNSNNIQDLSDTDLFRFINKYKFPIVVMALIGLFIYSSYYTVDANEKGVILRLGKYNATVGPGLHFKLPVIDQVNKVKVDFLYKLEFGYETIAADVKTRYSSSNYEDVSWMLTRNLHIAEVTWVVQYKISDPYKYLFKVKNVEKTIMDIAEAAMRLEVGDRSFDEVLGKGREQIANKAEDYMQRKLDEYNTGIKIQMVQLMPVQPPDPVADSFEEVNRAQQDKQIYENDAQKRKTQIINIATGDAAKMIDEAKGYKSERINQAEGDVARFKALLAEYKKYPQITKDRIYLERMESILSKVDNKVIIDSDLKNVLPFLNLNETSGKK